MLVLTGHMSFEVITSAQHFAAHVTGHLNPLVNGFEVATHIFRIMKALAARRATVRALTLGFVAALVVIAS